MSNNGDSRKLIGGWLSPDVAVAIGVQFVAGLLAFANLKSDVRNVETVNEQQDKAISELKTDRADDRKLLVDMNGKIEVLLDRTKPKVQQ